MALKSNKTAQNDKRLEKFILLLLEKQAKTQADLFSCQRQFARDGGSVFLKKDELFKTYQKMVISQKIKADKGLERLIKMKETRSMSGIVVVSILTKPYACPGKCLYCPTEQNLPKSYLKSEPAVMRAIANKFDPYLQTQSRIKALAATGHPIDKINIRIIGGTWSYYPKRYQTWFIKRTFEACNEFANGKWTANNTDDEQLTTTFSQSNHSSCTLANVQTINETAKCRIVEISIETRQDYIDVAEIKRLRKLGVTKVELGVQSIFDDVLELNHRGNCNEDTIQATKLLRDAGFKVSYQVMPNLPGSDAGRDLEMFKKIFTDPRYCPDYLKIYPLALVREAAVYRLYELNQYKPYPEMELVELLKQIKLLVPCYCRIERVIRDIPADSIIEGGSKISNLRQIVLAAMSKEGGRCHCIRCRELRAEYDGIQKPTLFRQDYEAGNGREIFLTIESADQKILLSLLRLRIPSQYFNGTKHFLKALDGAAIIREIHTYGRQVPIGAKEQDAAQHQGFGKRLLAEAEHIAKSEFNLNKIAVISGIGVREYFRQTGYLLEDSYLTKRLK